MRKTIIQTGLLMLFAAPVIQAQEKTDTAMMRKIREEEMANSQIRTIAHNLTDVAGPRLTNSPGYKKAVNWAVETLKQWGLQHTAAEPWGEFGKGWSTERSYIALKEPYYSPMFACPIAWTNGTNGPVTAPVIMLNKLDSATIDAHAADIKGKVVIVKSEEFTEGGASFKPNAHRYSDSALAKLGDMYMLNRKTLDFYLPVIQKKYNTQRYLQTKGALALLEKSSDKNGTLFVQGTPAWSKGIEPSLAQLVVKAEDYLRMQRLLTDGRDVKIELDVNNKWYTDDLNGYNVVGEIEGTDKKLKDQVVMIGGHLDSWHSGTGATDDGAGCIVMMEVVRLLKALHVQPRRTIRIALWGAEEEGLLGSFGYVKKHFGDPKDIQLKPEQKNVSAYFNLDNGTGKIRGIYLQNNEGVREIFKSWLEPFADLGATTVTSHNTGSTDHLSFDAVGIPGFQFVQDPLDYETLTHHSNMDVFDHLMIDDMKQAAIVIAAFVYNAAMRDEMLPRKPLGKPERFLFDTDLPL
jgi:carboxypeptidase Q